MKAWFNKYFIYGMIALVVLFCGLYEPWWRWYNSDRISKIRPGYEQMMQTKFQFWKIGQEIKAMSNQLSINANLAEIFSKIVELNPEITSWTNGTNPLPKFLPPGSYGRLEKWPTNSPKEQIPILWRVVNWREGVIVYLALSGDTYVVHTNEFAEILACCALK